jgi:flagellar basal-body rod protein FlgG
MIKGIHTVASGMLPYLKRQEAFANNLANINTPGFKKDGVFQKELSKAEQASIPTESDWEEPMVDEIHTDFSAGQMEYNGNDLNVAIEGDGFFVVSTENGERYTRDGAFQLDSEGFLTTASGDKVLTDGGPVALIGSKIKIDGDGKISVDGSQVAQLMVVDFAKPYQLVKAEKGLFTPKNADVTSQTAANFSIRQGYVEKSNVGAVEEMVNMVGSYRDYESGQKAIQIQDETLQQLLEKLGK